MKRIKLSNGTHLILGGNFLLKPSLFPEANEADGIQAGEIKSYEVILPSRTIGVTKEEGTKIINAISSI